MEQVTLTLDRADMTGLALAVSAAASASYHDDRLRTAIDEYKLAVRLWGALGRLDIALDKMKLADSIRQELAEARITDSEEIA